MRRGRSPFLLGTDDQGRDILSAILYGLRISLLVGFLGVAFSATLGITLGLIAGYLGGTVDAVIMRIADVQLTFPAILIALLIDGVREAVLGGQLDAGTTLSVLIVAIGLSFWVQYARTVRGSVHGREEQGVRAGGAGDRPAGAGDHAAARAAERDRAGAGDRHHQSRARHHHRGDAVLPRRRRAADQPSLGTLIRIGNEFLFSGEWWIVVFPGVALALLVLVDQPAGRLAARRAESEAAMRGPTP